MQLSGDEATGWNNANRGLASVYQLMQDRGDNFTTGDVYNELRNGGDYSDVLKYYGATTPGWHSGAENMSSIIEAAKNYGRYQTEQESSAEAQARAAVAERNKAADKFTASDGKEYSISREFSDYYKNWETQYNRLAAYGKAAQAVLADATAGAKEKEQAQKALDQAQADMKSMIGDLNSKMVENQWLSATETAPTTWAELRARGREGERGYLGEMTLEDILQRAASRQDEVYQPAPGKDVLDLFRERQEREYKRDFEKEKRRLERARLGQGIAGLAATIGDMVRASEGAPVSQRDWQRIYDNLTAQEKANINNYQVRMAKLNDDIRQQRMAEAQMAAAARDKAADRALKIQLKGAELEQSGRNADKQLEGVKYRADKQLEGTLNRPRQQRAQTNIPMFGTVKFVDSSQNDNTLIALYGKLKGMGLNFGIKDEVVGMDKIQEIKTRVLPALQNASKTATGEWLVEQSDGSFKTLTKKQVQSLLDYVDKVSVNSQQSYQPDDEESSENNGVVKYNSEDVR